MKKTLLSLTAGLLTCTGMLAGVMQPRVVHNDRYQTCPEPVAGISDNATRAAGEVEYSYAEEPFTAYGFNNLSKGTEVYLAFQIDPAVLSALAGNKITEISTYTGINTSYNKNPDRNITVFLTTGLGEAPFYEQAYKRSTDTYKKETVKLDVPQSYDATKPLYVGYRFTTSSATQYFLVVDGIPTSAPSCYYAMSTGSSVPAASEWENGAPEIGSCCMSCTIAGDNMPEVIVTPTAVSCPGTSGMNNAPEYSLSVMNLSSVNIESLNIHVEATGEQPYDINYIPTAEIPAGSVTALPVVGNLYTSTGDKEIKIAITKVNGKENPSATTTVSTKTIVVENLFPRVALFEVGTGTWCGWCPRSLVALDYIRENYAGKAIGVAYHSGDKMQTAAANTWLNFMHVQSFPTAFFNRIEEGAEPNNGSVAALETQLNTCIDAGSACQVKVDNFTPNADGKTGKVSAIYRFAENTDRDNYLVSLILVEDNVGPYKQTNNYNGGNAGPLFGWESAGSSVEYTYNEVARYITGCPGRAIPIEGTTLNKGQDYSVEFDVNLTQIKSEDPEPAFRAIAVISNKETNEVLNADAKQFVISLSGVNGIMSDTKAQISLGEGAITISNASNAAIYTLDGVKVADGSATGLAKGIYIVKADNLVQKVLVK